MADSSHWAWSLPARRNTPTLLTTPCGQPQTSGRSQLLDTLQKANADILKRHWYTQNIPGVLFACLSLLDLLFRRAPEHQAPSQRQSLESPPEPSMRGSSVLAGLGLGATFFMLHCFLSSSTVLISWSQNGHPINGPTFVHGIWVLLAICLGSVLACEKPELSTAPVWWMCGASGLSTLYARDQVRKSSLSPRQSTDHCSSLFSGQALLADCFSQSLSLLSRLL